MASIHLNHSIDLHKSKHKTSTDHVHIGIEKNLQFQGAEFEELVKKSGHDNKSNSNNQDSNQSRQQRSLNRYALRRQRLLQNPLGNNEDSSSEAEFQNHVAYEKLTDDALILEKQKNAQHIMHKNEHLHKQEQHSEKAEKHNLAAEFLRLTEFENNETVPNSEPQEANSLSDIANAWEEVIGVVSASVINGQTSVLVTLQSPVFFGSQIRMTQQVDQSLMVELLLINDESMEMARSNVQELEVNLKKRLKCAVKISLQRCDADGSVFNSENKDVHPKSLNEFNDLWGDDSVDIEELIM